MEVEMMEEAMVEVRGWIARDEMVEALEERLG